MSNRIKRVKLMVKKQDWFAFLVELIIVVLGITIAYQLNLYQQNSNNKKIEKALLNKLYIENQQNLSELEKVADLAYKKPLYLSRYLELLDALAVTKDSEKLTNNDSISLYFEEVVSSFSYPLKEQYLTTYLNKSSEIGEGTLVPELLKLQSLFSNLRYLRSTLLEYRINYIWVYTDQAYNRNTHKIDLKLLVDNTFRSRLMKLTNIEDEHTDFFKETISQVKQIDMLLQMNE